MSIPHCMQSYLPGCGGYVVLQWPSDADLDDLYLARDLILMQLNHFVRKAAAMARGEAEYQSWFTQEKP